MDSPLGDGTETKSGSKRFAELVQVSCIDPYFLRNGVVNAPVLLDAERVILGVEQRPSGKRVVLLASATDKFPEETEGNLSFPQELLRSDCLEWERKFNALRPVERVLCNLVQHALGSGAGGSPYARAERRTSWRTQAPVRGDSVRR